MSRGSSWLGIDLGGTRIKWEHIGADGVAVGAGVEATPASGHLAVTALIEEIMSSRTSADSALAGVGIAVPGHLTPTRDGVTLLPNVAGEWLGFPLQSHLAERTGFQPVLVNDARAFATAELDRGAARGARDVVFATVGTGVGGAIALDGRVVSSPRDAFGEVGHLTAVVGGEPCGCGGSGCVEAYAGGTAILRRAQERGVEVTAGLGALGRLAEVALTDPDAALVLTDAYDALAVGIASACALSGANLVVIGGAVGAELAGFAEQTRRRVDARRTLLGPVDVRSAALGARAGALGAAIAAEAASTAGLGHADLPHTFLTTSDLATTGLANTDLEQLA